MLTLLHLAALTLTILLLARLLPSVRIKGIGSAVVVAVVFSVLNVLLGWVIKAALFVPALLTLGLLFLFVPFIVNTVMLCLTDKLLHAFELQTTRALLLSSGAITLVNGAFHLFQHTRHAGY